MVKYYFVQKSWDDKESRIGTFTILSNAISFASINPGYAVFDEDGKRLYPV